MCVCGWGGGCLCVCVCVCGSARSVCSTIKHAWNTLVHWIKGLPEPGIRGSQELVPSPHGCSLAVLNLDVRKLHRWNFDVYIHFSQLMFERQGCDKISRRLHSLSLRSSQNQQMKQDFKKKINLSGNETKWSAKKIIGQKKSIAKQIADAHFFRVTKDGTGCLKLSLCSSGPISVWLVLSTTFLFMKVSFSPDRIRNGWLGSKHSLTN